MWDKLASIMGSGVSEVIDSIKKIAVDTWHIDPKVAAELDLEKEKLAQALEMKVMESKAELDKLDAEDRKNAREREKALGGNTATILAYSVTGGFFGVLGMLAFVEVPIGTKEVLYVMVGSLGTAWTGIIAYYFGSSAGSAAKHNIIERLSTK